MNTLMLAGHLGADPEIRFTSSGQKITILGSIIILGKTEQS